MHLAVRPGCERTAGGGQSPWLDVPAKLSGELDSMLHRAGVFGALAALGLACQCLDSGSVGLSRHRYLPYWSNAYDVRPSELIRRQSAREFDRLARNQAPAIH